MPHTHVQKLVNEFSVTYNQRNREFWKKHNIEIANSMANKVICNLTLADLRRFIANGQFRFFSLLHSVRHSKDTIRLQMRFKEVSHVLPESLTHLCCYAKASWLEIRLLQQMAF